MKNLTENISSADFATVINAHLATISGSLPGTADAAYLTTLNNSFASYASSYTPLAVGQKGSVFYQNLKNALRNSSYALKYFDSGVSGQSVVPADMPMAQYFNGKTYIAYAGATDHPYIITYDHSTKDFSAPVKCGTNPNPQDRHQQPTCFVDSSGYIHIFHGCHNSPVLYSRSTNPESIAAFTVKWTDVTSPIASGTYPKVFQTSNGTIYLFYRNGSAHHCFRTSVDGGDTWSEEIVIIQNYYNYGSIELSNDVFYFTFAYAASSGAYDRKNIIYFKYDLSKWYNISGTEKTLPINPSDCLVYDVGLLSTSDPAISVFNGVPYISFGVIDESNPSTITYKFTKWNGASWTVTTVTSGAIGYIFARCSIDARSASAIDVYLNTETSVEKWSTSDGGTTWAKVETVITNAAATFIEGGLIVRNGLREARIVIPEFNVTVGTYGSKIYLAGDNGLIKNI